MAHSTLATRWLIGGIFNLVLASAYSKALLASTDGPVFDQTIYGKSVAEHLTLKTATMTFTSSDMDLNFMTIVNEDLISTLPYSRDSTTVTVQPTRSNINPAFENTIYTKNISSDVTNEFSLLPTIEADNKATLVLNITYGPQILTATTKYTQYVNTNDIINASKVQAINEENTAGGEIKQVKAIDKDGFQYFLPCNSMVNNLFLKVHEVQNDNRKP